MAGRGRTGRTGVRTLEFVLSIAFSLQRFVQSAVGVRRIRRVIHLRIIAPAEQTDEVLDLLRVCSSTASIVAYRGAAVDPPGDVISCDVAEEDASYLVADLRAMRIHETGSIDLERLDASVSVRAHEAERVSRGASADAVLWENVGAKIADQGFVSWGLVALFALAGVIASVGILIDSAPIVVGAMAVSPDFGPIAAFSVGVVRRRRDYVVRGFAAVTVGFTAGVALALLSTVFLRSVGVAPDEFRRIGNSMAEAIAAPDGFSVVVALCAGAAGMLSVTLGKSAALVGVAISITTIPAAADIGVSLAYDDRVSFRGSALQLALNIISLLIAATLTLAIQRAIYVRRRRRHRLELGLAPLSDPLGRWGHRGGDVFGSAHAPVDGVTLPTPTTPTPRSSSEPE